MAQTRRTLRDDLGITLRGFLMGAADVVPGVSGGTMAFILGIYDELISSIRAVVPFVRQILQGQWKRAIQEFPWRFLLALGVGIAAAILSLARLLHWALETHPTLIYALFFGLIVASVFVVRQRVARWTAGRIVVVGLFAMGAYVLVGLRPAQTPDALWFIFLSGMIAICAMILPGISGAFILVLLGKYQTLLRALVQMDLLTIGVFMAGALIGIVSFASFLRWLLDHYHDATVAGLVGFMVGSLRELWPWKQAQYVEDVPVAVHNILPAALDGETLLAVALMALGGGLVLSIESLAKRKK